MHLSARVGSGGCDSEWGLPAAPCHPLFGGCTTPQMWHLSDGQGGGTVQPHRPRGEGGGHLVRPLTNAGAHSGQKSIPAQGLTHRDAAGAGSLVMGMVLGHHWQNRAGRATGEPAPWQLHLGWV